MTNLQTMYPAVNNSPQVSLTGNITAAAAQVPLSSVAALPAAPGLVTIGVDDDAELVRYNGISGNTLTGCERGFSGTTARVWEAGEAVYRAFTAYDHETFKANIEALNTGKLDTGGNGSNVTAAFSQATTKANIATGEKLSVIFGKLMKWYASFGAAAWMGTGTTSSTVALGNHTHTAAAVGAVPTSRTVNGKALSDDVTLTAPDVGARAGDWLPTLLDVGGVNENLIHNGDFGESVINQRGFAEETTSGKYTVDGWKLELNIGGAGSVVYDNTNKCLVLKRTGAGKTSLVKWLFEIPLAESTNITITLKLQDGSTYVRTVMPTNSNQTIDLDISKSLRVYISRQYFSIVNYSPTIENADIAVKWVKLEYGTSSTPNYPSSNPQQKSETTQRQYINYPGATSIPITMYDTNYIWATVFLPTPLRITPQLAAGTIKVYQQPSLGTEVTGFTTEFFLKGNALVVRLYKASHGYNGYNMCVRMDNAAFSAEM